MSEEIVATPEATETQTGAATEIPEVVDPESAKPEGEEPPSKPEPTAAEKEAAALKRRVDRLTRDKYQGRAEVEQLRAQLAASSQNAPEQQPEESRRFTEQDIAARAREIVEIEKVNDRSNAIAAAGEKAFPDFAEKMRSVLEELPLFDSKTGKPTSAMEAILDSDKADAILHYLGSNPEDAADIAELSPARQARRITQIEAQLAATPAAPEKPAPKTTSSAPVPLKSVKPSGQSDEPDINDSEAWIKWSNARDAAKRKR